MTPDGKLILRRRIQSGAHGTVFTAVPVAQARRGSAVPRTVAVKVAHGNAGHIRRLQKEATLLSQLPAHPHIIDTYPTKFPASQHPTTGAVYLPMRLMDTDLLEVLLSDRSVPRHIILHMAMQLTCALHHAHSHGVYHLDVKPENVLVDVRNMVVQLADFGMAVRLDATQAQHLIGQHGSASYAAPEVWDIEGGRQPKTGASAAAADVWSLGAVLFTMLFRRRCWSDVTTRDKDFRHYLRHGTFLLYDGESDVVDSATMKLLRAMLALDPAARPSLAVVARILTGLYNREVATLAPRVSNTARATSSTSTPSSTTSSTPSSVASTPASNVGAAESGTRGDNDTSPVATAAGTAAASASAAAASSSAAVQGDDDEGRTGAGARQGSGGGSMDAIMAPSTPFVARKSRTSVASPMSYGSVSPGVDTSMTMDDVVMVRA